MMNLTDLASTPPKDLRIVSLYYKKFNDYNAYVNDCQELSK